MQNIEDYLHTTSYKQLPIPWGVEGVIASAGITSITGQSQPGKSTPVSATADHVEAGGRSLTVSSKRWLKMIQVGELPAPLGPFKQHSSSRWAAANDGPVSRKDA